VGIFQVSFYTYKVSTLGGADALRAFEKCGDAVQQ
jgi:hypothetical protein